MKTRAETGALRLETAIKLAALALIALAVALALGLGERRFGTSGDKFDLRLAGVRPDASDDILDANGRKIGEEFYAGLQAWPWPSNALRREFILEYAATNELLRPPTCQVLLPDTNLVGYLYFGATALKPDGVMRVSHDAAVPARSRRRFLHWTWVTDVKRVDLAVRYWRQEPGEVVRRFDGPCAIGRTNRGPGGEELQAVRNRRDGVGVWADFHLSMPQNFRTPPWGIIATGRDGRRHLAYVSGQSFSAGRTHLDVSFWGLPMEDVLSVVLEQPRQKVFRRVRVSYPRRPARAYPAFQDQAAALLGPGSPPASQLTDYNPQGPAEALKLLAVARGELAWRAWIALSRAEPPVDFKSLPPETLHRAQDTARLWIETVGNPQLRCAGFALGVLSGGPAGVSAALEFLRARESGPTGEVTSALSRAAPDWSEAEVRVLKEFLLTRDGVQDRRGLVRLLRACGSPAALQAMLELAGGNRQDVWWAAVLLLPDAGWESPAAETPRLQQRLFIVRGRFPPLVRGERWRAAPEVEAAAARELATLLTPDLHRTAPETCADLYRRLTEVLPQAEVTTLTVKYLLQLPANDLHPALTARMVRQLNQWHGQDFGRLGREPRTGGDPKLAPEEWRKTLAAVAAWHDSRRR